MSYRKIQWYEALSPVALVGGGIHRAATAGRYKDCGKLLQRVDYLQKRQHKRKYRKELARIREDRLVQQLCGAKQQQQQQYQEPMPVGSQFEEEDEFAGWSGLQGHNYGVAAWEVINPGLALVGWVRDQATAYFTADEPSGIVDQQPTAIVRQQAPPQLPEYNPEDPFGPPLGGGLPSWAIPAAVGGGVLLLALAVAGRSRRA